MPGIFVMLAECWAAIPCLLSLSLLVQRAQRREEREQKRAEEAEQVKSSHSTFTELRIIVTVGLILLTP
jgi:hypothetical protein